MEKFNCYICFNDVEVVFAKQVCEQQKHQVCSLCFAGVNCDKCPMCRQKNPNYIQPIDESDSDETETLLVVRVLNNQTRQFNRTAFLNFFAQLNLYSEWE